MMAHSIWSIVLPKSLRMVIRKAHRKLVFRIAMQRFLKKPDDCLQPGNTLIPDLIYGWGNESWSALDEYLTGCIRHAIANRGEALECGSGLTTLVLGAIAQKNGHNYWVLEHNPEWASKLRKYLKRYKLDSVILFHKPLKDFGEYSWYDAPLKQMPDHFDLVICDGPPGTTKGGRYGLFSVMGNRIKPGCIILLDDAHREDEIAIANQWHQENNAPFVIKGQIKPYIEMKVIGNHAQDNPELTEQ